MANVVSEHIGQGHFIALDTARQLFAGYGSVEYKDGPITRYIEFETLNAIWKPYFCGMSFECIGYIGYLKPKERRHG